MAKEKEIKTNAMRILDRMKIPYTHYTYECDEFIDGMQIVEKLNLKPEQVYKTLVTQGHSKAYFVFVIPVAEELDLKKAARAMATMADTSAMLRVTLRGIPVRPEAPPVRVVIRFSRAAMASPKPRVTREI